MNKNETLKINPVVLILINVIAPSMYIFISGKYLQIYLLIFASVLLLVIGCYKRMLGLLAVFGSFTGVYLITINNEKLQGIAVFLIIVAQSIPCLFLASVLVSKYNSAQLLSALETMKMPRVIVVAVTITLKYIPTFGREFGLLRESMRLRGIEFTLKRPIRSFRYFIVPQLFRCSALADEVTAAGLVKGIDYPMKRSSYFEEQFRWYDAAVLVLFIAGLVGGFVWMK